jgi:hypothetical protein
MNAISLSAGLISTSLAHPLDFLKIKTFLISEGVGIHQKGFNMGYNPLTIFDNFLNRGYGTRVLYTGFGNALMGRLSFLFGRNNAYKMLYDHFKPHKTSNDLLYFEKGLISGLASLVGSVLSNPFMVRYVREVGDIGRNVKYHRAGESLRFTQGFLPYATRMFLLNTFLIWPYNSINEKLYVVFGDVFTNRIFSTFCAAAIGAMISTPFDNIRTRIQYMSENPKINRMNYRGMMHCYWQVIQNENFFSLFAGVKVAYAQMVVYTLSTIYLCDLLVDCAKQR